MGWQEFMRLQRRQLEERREGKLRRAFYRYIDALERDDMEDRLAAEWLEVGWLKQREECRRKGVGAPPIPKHLG